MSTLADFLPNLARYERMALAEADARNIGTRGERGTDDARDAFRHAYISALMVREYSIYSRPLIRQEGMALEVRNLTENCPPRPASSAMDITNNEHGLRYNPATGESPADYAHRLLRSGVLITQPEDAPAIGWIERMAAKQAKRCAVGNQK